MKIRIASENDIPTLTRIVNQTWKVAYKDIVSEKDIELYTNNETRAEKFGKLFTDEKAVVLICEYENSLCGMISATSCDIKNFSECAYIIQFYVLPDFQNKGVGHALMNSMLSLLRDSGYQHVLLDTLEKNHNARGFYEKLGFKFCGAKASSFFEHGIMCIDYIKELNTDE